MRVSEVITEDLTRRGFLGGLAGNSFSGQWRVMIDGEEVWRFRGVGNNQADANRIGQTWILDQIRQGSLSPVEGADVEVLPVMI